MASIKAKRPYTRKRMTNTYFAQGGTSPGASSINHLVVNGQAFALPTYQPSWTPPARKVTTTDIETPNSTYLDYNDPYVINSVSDVFLNREAKKRRYGDWTNIPVIGDLLSVPVGMADLAWQSAFKPLISGISDGINDAQTNQTDLVSGALSGLGKGTGNALLNALVSFSETTDILANPVKGLFLDGNPARGFVRGLGVGPEGRHNYDWDTGNVVTDIALELVSDPLNWISFGAKAAATSGAKVLVKEAASEAGETLTESTAKAIAKRLTRKVISPKNLDDVVKNMDSVTKAAVGDQSLFQTLRKTALKGMKLTGQTDMADAAARDIAQRLTLKVTDSVTDSLSKLSLGRRIYRASEGVQGGLVKSVLYTSGLPVVGNYKVAKSVKNLLNAQPLKQGTQASTTVLRDSLASKLSDAVKPAAAQDADILNRVQRRLLKVDDTLDAAIRNFKTGADPAAGVIRRLSNTVSTYTQNMRTALNTTDTKTFFKTYMPYIRDQVEQENLPRYYQNYLRSLQTVDDLDETIKVLAGVEDYLKTSPVKLPALRTQFNDAVIKLQTDLVDLQRYRIATPQAGHLSMYFNPINSLRNAPMFQGVSDTALLKWFKAHPEYVVSTLVESPKTNTGYRVLKSKINTVADLANARRLNGAVLPIHTANKLLQRLNTYTVNPAMRIINAVALPFKSGYLGSVGMIIRNLIDGLSKNGISLHEPLNAPKSVKHWFQTARLYTQYDAAIKWMALNNIDFKTADPALLSYWLKRYPGKLQMSDDMFYLIYQFMEEGPSGGQVEAIREQLTSLQKAVPDKTKFDVALDAYTKQVMDLPVSKQLSSMNDYVEKTMRLSAYFRSLEEGQNTAKAMHTVLKTHFDYSDKSLGLSTFEAFIPFMNFAINNVEYFVDVLEKEPHLAAGIADLLRPIWNLDELTTPNPYLYEAYDSSFNMQDELKLKGLTPWATPNASLAYQTTAGNPHKATGLYADYIGYNGEQEQRQVWQNLKLNPSMMDAASVLSSPINNVSDRLLAPYKMLLDGLVNKKSPTTEAVLDALPYLGVLRQRYGFSEGAQKSVMDRVKDSDNPANAFASFFGVSYVREPKGTKEPKNLQELSDWAGRKYYEYKTFGLAEKYDPYVKYATRLAATRNKQYPRKGGLRMNYYGIRNKRWFTPKFQAYDSSRTQYRMNEIARPKSIYRDLYTPSGVSRLKLALGPTTVDNVKYRVANIRYRLRSRWSWYR